MGLKPLWRRLVTIGKNKIQIFIYENGCVLLLAFFYTIEICLEEELDIAKYDEYANTTLTVIHNLRKILNFS